jgi:hypothetical protein
VTAGARTEVGAQRADKGEAVARAAEKHRVGDDGWQAAYLERAHGDSSRLMVINTDRGYDARRFGAVCERVG